MDEGNEINAWKRVFRSIVLVKLVEKTDKVEIADRILKLNDHKIRIEDEEKHIEDNFVVRADLLAGEYQIFIPLCARSPEQLEAIEYEVLSQNGVSRESLVLRMDDQLDERQVYHPYPPHKATGYISESERNPSDVGPTGRNAWG
jgi:hypothetical protein